MNTCTIQSCSNKFLAKGLCSKHYYRQKRGQSVLGKSRFDKRPAIIEDGYAKLELGNKKGYTLIDIEYSYLDEYNWSLDGYGYPCCWKDGKILKIHQAIMGKSKPGFVIDHINRDKLDNRKANLRHVTQRVNMLNSDISKGWTIN